MTFSVVSLNPHRFIVDLNGRTMRINVEVLLPPKDKADDPDIWFGKRDIDRWKDGSAATEVEREAILQGLREYARQYGLVLLIDDGEGVQTFAEAMSRARGGTSLETLLVARGLVLPDMGRLTPKSAEYDEALQCWRLASKAYAQGAAGEVRVVTGEVPQRLQSRTAWFRDEFPALRENRAVTRIVAVDPLTEAETVLWTRP